jgi:hypothetical protein
MSFINFYIRFSPHYKLYVQQRDQLVFEEILQENNIDFYSNIKEQAFLDTGIRYFLREADRSKIDALLIKHQLIAQIESHNMPDFTSHKKIMKVYLLVALIVVLLLLVVIVFDVIRSWS